MLALTVKETSKDVHEWVNIDLGDRVIRVSAKRASNSKSVIIIFDFPEDIKIYRDEIKD
jgi:uncharacterized protein (DUF2249 family)